MIFAVLVIWGFYYLSVISFYRLYHIIVNSGIVTLSNKTCDYLAETTKRNPM